MNIANLAMTFWYREWRKTLCQKHFEQAKESWKNYQLWKRREKIEEMLTQICEMKNFGGVYDR